MLPNLKRLRPCLISIARGIILNSIRGNDLEKNINVFKEHGVDITPMDIEYAAGFLLVMPNLPKTLTNVRELS